MPEERSRPTDRALQVFVIAWILVAAGSLLVGARLSSLPATVPVYRTILGTPIRLAPTSWTSVLRVPLMGAAQLAAVSILAFDASRHRVATWSQFWKILAAAI